MAGRAPKRKKTRAADGASLFPDDPPPTAEAAAPVELPASWAQALAPEFGKPYFQDLVRFVAAERVQSEVYPPEDDVYNAFKHTPLDKVEVVILGQDPYPNPGQGHGLCFSVRPGVPIPGSLRNIYKELHADLGIPPAKHGYLAAWAERGVLLLNAVLTVRAGKPNSHAGKGWERFTDAALSAVSRLANPVVFILWGAYAQKKEALIDQDRHAVLKSAHPSPLSAKAGFFGSKPFSKTNAALKKFGRKPIDWRLPDNP
jgi:uracil-DNA glycosylase